MTDLSVARKGITNKKEQEYTLFKKGICGNCMSLRARLANTVKMLVIDTEMNACVHNQLI
jgi:hypothetical protein